MVRDAVCDLCGCSVRLPELLWHEASHDQARLLFESLEKHAALTDQALTLLHELINDLEGRLADVERWVS